MRSPVTAVIIFVYAKGRTVLYSGYANNTHTLMWQGTGLVSVLKFWAKNLGADCLARKVLFLLMLAARISSVPGKLRLSPMLASGAGSKLGLAWRVSPFPSLPSFPSFLLPVLSSPSLFSYPAIPFFPLPFPLFPFP